MRMWGVNPRKLCTKHLLGEHVEMHMFVGHIKAGKAMGKFVTNGLVDTSKIKERHDALAEEIARRGFNHDSPLEYQDTLAQGKVSIRDSERELRRRCKNCYKD